MFKRRLTALVVLSTLSIGAFALELDETRSTLDDQKDVAVTIYNSDLALVKDQRKLRLKAGLNNLAIRDVSGQMRPETALLRSLSQAGSLTLLEQNFNFDLLTPAKLLEKYVGKTITIVKTHPQTGVETMEQATVLSANDGGVFRVGNSIETGLPGRIVYDSVPENLRDRPTLVTQINNKGVADQTIELSYLTSGLGWRADYVTELNANDTMLDLSGWVTLTNTSGATYKNAKLQLVAGDINRVQEQFARPTEIRMAKGMMTDAATRMAEESLLEYHLYTLDRPTTIAENQTKQVALLSASQVPVRKELQLTGANYYYQGQYGDLGTKIKVGVFVEFDNKETAKLGMPLPKGIMRVYKKDSAGNAQFVGEDHIDHTAKNEVVRLKLGEAFDVIADKKQTDFKVLPQPSKGLSMYESAYELTLKNAKKEAVTVTVVEPIGGDWRIISESQPSKKTSSTANIWKVTVPAEGKTTLSYRVSVKY